ncbi:MAG: ABC transporter permease [Pseudomonadota bacterium]
MAVFHTSNERDAPAASTFGTLFDVNWLGLWTLYRKEVLRFLKVLTQTVLAPIVTTLLFLTVFVLALGSDRQVGSLTFVEFLAPGLVMMAIVQNAFANTSSSIGIAKVQGNIVDYLMPPLSHQELVFGIAMGGVTRGALVGVVVWLTMIPAVGLQLEHPFWASFHVLSASLTLALAGLLTAIWADKFDQMAAVTNFIITPLSFLSGTFYSVDRLPDGLWWVAHLNPVFFMIDGLRFALAGQADTNPWVGFAVLVAVNVALWRFCLFVVRSGYKLRP